MRIHALRGLFAALCFLLALQATQAAEPIKWLKSLKTALSEAKKSRRLVMVDFYADWCGYCKKLDRETFTDKRVIQLAGQVIPVKLNAEDGGEGQQAAMRYAVQGLPAIFFLNPEGKQVGTIGGFMPAAPFAQEMEKYISVQRDLPSLEARVKQNPGDAGAAARLARIYANTGEQTRAAQMIKQAETADPKSPALAAAYHALGDTYQNQRKFDTAIAYFRKAIQQGKDPYDLAYSHISIAVCYLSQRKIKEAIPSLKATIAVPNAPRQLKDQAQLYLNQIQQMNSRG
jgi:thioredoxin-related protein